MKLKMKQILRILIPVLFLLLVIAVSASCYTVRENEYACVVRFSKIIDVTPSAGLHFKLPFFDRPAL